jgi:hypothetical protein
MIMLTLYFSQDTESYKKRFRHMVENLFVEI